MSEPRHVTVAWNVPSSQEYESLLPNPAIGSVTYRQGNDGCVHIGATVLDEETAVRLRDELARAGITAEIEVTA